MSKKNFSVEALKFQKRVNNIEASCDLIFIRNPDIYIMSRNRLDMLLPCRADMSHAINKQLCKVISSKEKCGKKIDRKDGFQKHKHHACNDVCESNDLAMIFLNSLGFSSSFPFENSLREQKIATRITAQFQPSRV